MKHLKILTLSIVLGFLLQALSNFIASPLLNSPCEIPSYLPPGHEFGCTRRFGYPFIGGSASGMVAPPNLNLGGFYKVRYVFLPPTLTVFVNWIFWSIFILFLLLGIKRIKKSRSNA